MIPAVLLQASQAGKGIDWEKIVGPVIGFFVGWALFELTERRKVWMAQRALRGALVSELRHTEVLLSSIVAKYCFLAKNEADVKTFADEIRWFVNVGKKRAMSVGLALDEPAPQTLSQFNDLNDATLVALFSGGKQETTGTSLILPVIDAMLAGRTTGFSDHEIEALSTVRWQAHLLAQDAEWTKKFLDLSFTVTDPKNHDIVSINHDTRVASYSRRAITMLKCVRTALTTLGATEDATAW